METGNVSLNNLFNGLSSIYRTDLGMLNSDLFTVLNAYAESFQDVQRKLNQVAANRYISTAEPDALEANFGILIDFPKPPRLNTLTDGDEIYRAMVRSMFKVFQSGSTNASMNEALDTAVSYLTIDPRTSDAVTITNYTKLLTVDSQIQLSWNAVQVSGALVVGPARPEDIVFFPADVIPTAYDDNNKIVYFTGTANTGTSYQVFYKRDNRTFRGTNWINITDSEAVSPSPFALNSGTVSTYNNIGFSYWYSTYNADGNGVVIDEFKIDRNDSALAWRLPEKTINFVSPYSGEVLTRTIEFYNLSGTAYDIEHLDSVNLDTYFTDEPLSYYNEVSSDFTDYYIRYSQNNSGPNVALDTFTGALPKFLKKYQSIEFTSDNFGQLDFFEKSSGFDVNNLFGTGTRHIWINVPNANGKYILSSDFLVPREFSLHENTMFFENFETGKLNKIESTYPDGVMITDLVGVPLFEKEDCAMLIAPAGGIPISASPIITGSIVPQINRVQVDFFDPLNSGTSTFIDVSVTGSSLSDYTRFRFGIETDVLDYEFSTSDPLASSKTFGFVETYFENALSTNRTVTVQNFSQPLIFESYNFSSGTNPNILFSNQSMLPSGVVTITPDAPNSLIGNTDTWSVQFEDLGTSNLTFSLSRYRFLGTGTSSGTPYYASERYDMFPSASFWSWSSDTVVSFNPSTEVITMQTLGGTTPIPYVTGLNTVSILKGVGFSYNGVVYTGSSFDNPGLKWTDVGTGQGANISSINIGDPNSFSILTDGDVLLDHYELSNSVLRQQFLDTLSSGSGFTSTSVPYFYQIFTDPNNTISPKVFLNQFPRNEGWQRLIVDFGVGFSGLTASLGESVFLNQSNIGFSGVFSSPSGLALISNSNYPDHEFSYFDNIQASYYNSQATLPEYEAAVSLIDDWNGSALNENAVIDNKFFELDPQPNFQFNVLIKGLDENFIFIINKIIEKLKPAHTIATSIFEIDQTLDTTSLIPIISNNSTDWESGNINNNIIILPSGNTSGTSTDLPGLITISGSM